MTAQQQLAWHASVEALVACSYQVTNHPDGQHKQFTHAALLAENALQLLEAAGMSSGFEPIGEKHKDGKRWLLWCVHPNAKYDPENYAGEVIGRWIDHNGGGFTWHGHMGVITHAAPLPGPPDATEPTP